MKHEHLTNKLLLEHMFVRLLLPQAITFTHNKNCKLHLAILCSSFLWLICQHAIFQLGQRELLSHSKSSVMNLLQAFEPFLPEVARLQADFLDVS